MKAEKILIDFFNLLDEFAREFSFNPDSNNVYDSIVRFIKETKNIEEFKISSSLRQRICYLLKSAKAQQEESCIYHILYPGSMYEKITDEQKIACRIENLNDYALLVYFRLFVTIVNFKQYDNKLLLKYSPALYNVGWSEITKLTRGKVLDVHTKEILVYPFDKFFNLNEIEENTVESLKAEIEVADAIIATEKLDGSLILITKMRDGELLVHTTGVFYNEHSIIAKEILESQYPVFIHSVMPGITYMFELISKKDPHIIQNYEKEGLFLLAARDVNTGDFKNRKWLVETANEYNLDIVEECEFKSLDDFIERADKAKEGVEGWVFKIIKSGKPDHFIKLKTEEYLALRRLARGIPIKKVYGLSISNRLQEIILAAPPELQEDIASTLEEIDVIKIKACEEAARIAKELLDKYELKFEDFVDGTIVYDKRSIFIEFVKEAQKNLFATAILRYVRYPKNKYHAYDTCNVKTFMKLVKYFEE